MSLCLYVASCLRGNVTKTPWEDKASVAKGTGENLSVSTPGVSSRDSHRTQRTYLWCLLTFLVPLSFSWLFFTVTFRTCLNISLWHKNNSLCPITCSFYYSVNKISPCFTVAFVGVGKPCSFFPSTNIRSTPQTCDFVTIRTSENNFWLCRNMQRLIPLLYSSFCVTGWLLEPAVSFEKAVMIYDYKQQSCRFWKLSLWNSFAHAL